MNVCEFLSTETAKLPKEQLDNEESFPAFLKGKCEIFLEELAVKLKGETDYLSKEIINRLPIIQSLSNVVIKTVEKYYDGSPSTAYEYFSNWLSKNQEPIDQHKTIEIGKERFVTDIPLFRMRVHDQFIRYPKEMFHIPFEQRRKVSTQRYSIPGYPCLYLGASSYVCWKELGHPPFDSVYLARFEPTRNIKLLDIGFTPQYLSLSSGIIDFENNEDNRKFFISQILLWPLKCACMVQSLHTEVPFKPEYIIPQFLLQYIKDDQAIDGIRYYSTFFDDEDSSLLGLNYAFPVKTSAPSGHCKDLKQLFNLTEVMPWQILSADRGRLPLSNREFKNINTKISLVRNEPVFYRETIFGHMDDYGMRLDAKPL